MLLFGLGPFVSGIIGPGTVHRLHEVVRMESENSQPTPMVSLLVVSMRLSTVECMHVVL